MRIGNKQIVHFASLIIPPGEDGWIEFPLGAWDVKIKIQFDDLADPDAGRTLTLEGVEDRAIITFFNWNNSLGTAIIEPAEFATTNDGRKVFFNATHWRIGEVNRIDVQFLMED